MLRAAGIKRARALVITIPDSRTAIRIIEVARSRNPEIPILVRTQDDLHLEDLEYAGASRVVPEQLESSMMMATHMLEMLDIPDDEIQQLVEKTRTDHYHNLRSYFHGEQAETVEDIAPDHYRRHTVVLTAGSQAIGKTIDELGLCKTGVNILSVRRGQIRGDKPVLDMKLIEADAVLLEGGTEELEHAERVILRGH